VELVQVVAFALAQGRVALHHAVLDGDDVGGVGLQEEALLVSGVLFEVGLALDEFLDDYLHLL